MKFILSLSLLALAAPAFARITIFNSTDAAAHLLKSNELRSRQDLQNLELSGLSVAKIGRLGNQTFNFTVRLSNDRGGLPTVCTVNAVVKTEIIQANGITSSRLSTPSVSQASCTR